MEIMTGPEYLNRSIPETPHRGVIDQIKDREAIERLIEALEISTRNLGRNGQWLIVGKYGTIQTLGDRETFVLYAVARSKRKFSAIKNKLIGHGMRLLDDRGEQGSLVLSGLPTEPLAKEMRTVLGLKKRPSKTMHSKNGEVLGE
jgi:hypothetical protein